MRHLSSLLVLARLPVSVAVVLDMNFFTLPTQVHLWIELCVVLLEKFLLIDAQLLRLLLCLTEGCLERLCVHHAVRAKTFRLA